jgi:lipid-binding SYLF domain-containing protein
MKKVLVLVILVSLAVAVGCSQRRNSPNQTAATQSAPGPSGDRPEIRDRLNDSARDLTELINAPDNGIPQEILAKAKCVAVVPDMVKGGFVIGGQHGRGVVTCRTPNGWSAPAPITVSGGSWGAQIGVQAADVVLLFLNDHAVQSLLSDKVKLGAEASIAAGPVGRHAEADTDLKLNAEILSYSRTKGLFAGLDLSGAAVRQDNDSTVALYGKEIDFRTLLSGNVPAPAAARNFLDTVNRDFVTAARNE